MLLTILCMAVCLPVGISTSCVSFEVTSEGSEVGISLAIVYTFSTCCYAFGDIFLRVSTVSCVSVCDTPGIGLTISWVSASDGSIIDVSGLGSWSSMSSTMRHIFSPTTSTCLLTFYFRA